MRFHAVIALCLLGAGCGDDTIVRLTVRNGEMMAAPAQLRVTLVGADVTAAPKVIAPVPLPGVVVIHSLPSATPRLCVVVEALDGGAAVVAEASVTVQLVAHGIARADVTLAPPGLSGAGCTQATDGGVDLATGDLAMPPPADLARTDASILVCPAKAIFCDDFETGDISKWSTHTAVAPLASLDVQMLTVAHGAYALHAAVTNNVLMQNNLAEVEYILAASPPLAIRANIYTPQPLGSYTMVMALYEDTGRGFGIGGDGNSTWVVTEDQSGSPDHHSDMVPTSSGQWHCVELVIDADGMVSLFVDNHQLLAPFPRARPVTYTSFVVGITRTVSDTNVFVDDAAIGPQRLYCP